MSDDGPTVERRRLLRALGASGLAAVAGCTDGGDGGPGDGTETVETLTDLDTPPDPTPSTTETGSGGGQGGGNCPAVEYDLNTGYDQDAGSTISTCDPYAWPPEEGTPDDDWEVTAEDISSGQTPRPATVIEPHPAWNGPFQDSEWISVNCRGDPGLSGEEELFEFTYCFCLNEGFNRPELDLRLRADDAIEDVRLNGNSLPFSGTGSFSGQPIEETYDQRFRRFFRAGENCLTVVIRDTGGVITGLNLAGTVSAENGECCEGTCDLGIEKTHAGDFEFGGTGTYVIDVCNEGDGVCNRAAEVRDELPPGVTFDSASGQGWNVTNSGGSLDLTHPNQDGLDPGECLPPVEVEVSVAPLEEFPAEGGLSNCAELVTGGQHADNDRDCTTPCVAGERTFEAGVDDQYDTANDEPASPSDGLVAASGGNLKDFDDPSVNTWFGHTFDGLRPASVAGEICEAELEICLRPEGTLDENDRINLGVWDADGNPVGDHWSRALGNQDDEPGLFDRRWDKPWGEPAEESCITLDLSELEEEGEDEPPKNLLPELNTYDRLSIKVQDDTAVDFANLSVTYCCDGADGECDLSVDKRVESEFHFGGQGRYVVEVCNDGDGPCEGPVQVTDDLPDGMVLAGHGGNGWDCQHQGGEVTCRHPNAGGLAPGECLPTLVLDVEVPPADEWAGGDLARNCVALERDGRVVDESCVEHPITGGGGGCQFTVEKSVASEFRFGDVGVYAIEVCNDAEARCPGPVEVTDDLPDGMTFRGGAGTGWSVSAGDGTVVADHANDDGLGPGECLPVLELEVEVVPEREWPHDSNVVENCAQLRVEEPRQLVTDCVEHEVGDGGGCQLSIEKRVENPFEFGGAGAYGFRVCNEGDEVCQAEVVEVVDDLPEGFTFMGGGGDGWSCDVVDPDTQTVACTYEGVSLEPGECLPRNVWEIEVVSEEEWPHETNTVQNCARLSTPQEQLDEDCIEHGVE